MEGKLPHSVANFRHALGEYIASLSYFLPPTPSLPRIDPEILSEIYYPGSIRTVFSSNETLTRSQFNFLPGIWKVLFSFCYFLELRTQ